jgi:hypothetical protein
LLMKAACSKIITCIFMAEKDSSLATSASQFLWTSFCHALCRERLLFLLTLWLLSHSVWFQVKRKFDFVAMAFSCYNMLAASGLGSCYVWEKRECYVACFCWKGLEPFMRSAISVLLVSLLRAVRERVE